MTSSDNGLRLIRSGLLGSYDNFDKTPFTVSWSITGRCPYKCSYCYEVDSPKRSIESKLADLLLAIPRLKKIISPIFSTGREIEIRLFGGEPTYHRDFFEIVRNLHESFPGVKLFSLSNGYRPISFFKKLFDIDASYKFNFSVHFESFKEAEFLNKVTFLHERNSIDRITIQFIPSYRQKVKEFTYKFRKIFPNIRSTIQLLRSKENNFKALDRNYTEEDLTWTKRMNEEGVGGNHKYFIDLIDSSGKIYRKTFTFEEAHLPELSNFRSLNCVYPMRFFTIDEHGNAYRNFCLRKPSVNLYSIDYQEVDFDLGKPTKCISNFCVCRPMRNAPKYLSPEYAPLALGGKCDLSHDIVNISELP